MGQMRSFGPSRCSAFLVGKAVSTLRSATALHNCHGDHIRDGSVRACHALLGDKKLYKEEALVHHPEDGQRTEGLSERCK